MFLYTNGIISSSRQVEEYLSSKSIDLDGVADYVDLNSSSNLEFTNNFTLSAWIKVDSIGSNYYIIDTSSSSSTGNGYSLRVTSTGKVRFWSYNASNDLIDSSTTLSANTWYHVAAVRDTSQNLIYINGALDNSISVTQTNLVSDTSRLRIGSSQLLGGYFNGHIDEVSFYDYELSSSDLASIYGVGVPNNISPLSPKSWYKCGENDTSTTLYDNGTESNDGTLVSFNTYSTDVPLFNSKSIELDGLVDYVTFGSMTGSSLAITGDISISMWLKFSNSGGTEYAMSMGDQYGIYTSAGTIRGFSRVGGTFTSLSSVGTFNDNTWHHVLYVKNATNMLLYIDGSLNASNSSGGATTTSGLDMRLGARYTTAAFYQGSIDEVAIWDNDQSSNISTIYSGVPTDISSLSPISWWRCGDGDISPTLTDRGSDGNDGTMVSFTTFSTDVPT